ncbi:DHS-like NAD/FAD-binding domain-containing protein [Pisolithus orientalis]|uniref:DHS-like NAD/FAD-binding domain-containing protein n=1 Tax=Pisolithus orientalis TaxID=936130 RepID=UPI002225901E|nr:DHS-like NAD/FAD-binding domain-containing protein [Pisolithus orientalis]KAI6010913.1 DHS-like NAD/FAD-binding domain-containing protein [Pisolithus orientalis]
MGTSTSGQKQDDSHQNARAKPKISPLHGLQLRAFLSAADDVDADSDTLDDLMDGVGEEICSSMTDQDSLSGLSDTEHVDSTPDNSIFNGAISADATDSDTEQIDPAELHALEQEAERAWTKEEIGKMMHFVREKGMGPFIREYVVVQQTPIVKLLFAFGISLCPELRAKSPATLLYFLRVAISRVLRLREKLPQHNTIEDAVSLIQRSRRIIILTGAGISLASPCGIPDFRSRNGLYASLKANGQYDLDDPQQMFDIHYFKEHPAGQLHYQCTAQIYPSNFIPSPCHRFIKLIEDKGKLLRNYTQNIDTLETQAGIKRVLQCHGSFKTATCLLCRKQVPGVEIEREILERRVPYCKTCLEAHRAAEAQKSKVTKKGKKRKNEWDDDSDDSDDDMPVGVMKPDITFFGEKLNDEFDRALEEDRDKVDLLLVIGTSLKVSPVSEIFSHLPHSVPQILINRTPIRHINPDVVLLGNADDIVQYLCERLHWELPPPTPQHGLQLDVPVPLGKNGKRSSTEMMGIAEPVRVGESHVWLFQGAEGGKWVEDIREKYNHVVKQNVPHSEPGAKKARVT